MGRTRTDRAHLTPNRATRLFKLLTLLGDGPQPRDTLSRKLKLDPRGFYRDLNELRTLGVTIDVQGTKYQLVGALDDALAMLPFPDPGLSFYDALVLSRGSSAPHKKLRKRYDGLVGQRPVSGNGKPAKRATVDY
jgi:biotin operon repressor